VPRLVPQLGDGRQDARPRRFGDAAGAVDDVRYGRGADARSVRDVPDGRFARQMRLAELDLND
jgi:hypothetical protein